MGYKTEQEEFWAGSFGDEYIDRNKGEVLFARKISLFHKMLNKVSPSSCIEFGANIGLNLQVMKLLFPEAKLAGVEINKKAISVLNKIPNIDVFANSIYDFSVSKQYDLSLACGIMIHLNPELLPKAYDVLYQSSCKYICIAEYYNPTPVEVLYRGNAGKLFKRDFAGEFMDRYNDVTLVDYGFVYHRDPVFPYDDVNWFLLKK